MVVLSVSRSVNKVLFLEALVAIKLLYVRIASASASFISLIFSFFAFSISYLLV
jgi:hypothetical protein